MNIAWRIILLTFVLQIPTKALLDLGSPDRGIIRGAVMLGLPAPMAWAIFDFVVSLVATYFIARAVWRDRPAAIQETSPIP